MGVVEKPKHPSGFCQETLTNFSKFSPKTLTKNHLTKKPSVNTWLSMNTPQNNCHAAVSPLFDVHA